MQSFGVHSHSARLLLPVDSPFSIISVFYGEEEERGGEDGGGQIGWSGDVETEMHRHESEKSRSLMFISSFPVYSSFARGQRHMMTQRGTWKSIVG